MRFGIDVAQQRMPWDEVVSPGAARRGARLRRRLGLRPLPADVRRGAGRGLRRRHHPRGAGRADVAHPARAARHRRHLPAPVGVRVADGHRRPRLARPARAVARRRVVRQGAHRARHPVPAHRRALRPARGRARDLHPAHDRRRRCPTTARSCRCRDAQVLPMPVQRPHPPIWIGGNGPKRTLPLVARYADVWHAFGTPNSLAERLGPDRRAGRARPGASRRTSCGPGRCRSTTSTPPASTPPSGATPASATSSAAGPAPGGARSRPSPARSCPTSPDPLAIPDSSCQGWVRTVSP